VSERERVLTGTEAIQPNAFGAMRRVRSRIFAGMPLQANRPIFARYNWWIRQDSFRAHNLLLPDSGLRIRETPRHRGIILARPASGFPSLYRFCGE